MKKTAASVFVILISLLLLLTGCGSRNEEHGSGIEVRNNGQYIQWTNGDGQWHDLVDIRAIADSINGSIDKKSIEIENSGGYIKWRYADSEWNNLVSVTSLTGKDGKDGADGKDGTSGKDGKSIEIRRADEYVQWRYSDSEWQNLVALSDIAGPAGADGQNGKTPEFRVEAGTLQWKYASDSIWLNLYDLSLLKGTDGKDGINGKDGADGKDGRDGVNGQDGNDGREIEVRASGSHIQWRYSNGEWQNLVALSDIAGPAGADGQNGKTPEFRVEAGTLQWKYASDSIWLNLYDLSLLKGTDGKDGINGKDGADGKDGRDGVNGQDGADGKNGKDGICAGYFAASGEVFSNSWNSPLPFTTGSKSGELISYNTSSKQITLAKGHSYSLVFSGTVSVSAKKDETICGAALIDGQNNADVMLTTQTFVNAAKNGQTSKLTIAYNTIYTAKDSDTVLTFMFNNMTFQDTTLEGARYSITIIALN